MAEQDLPGTSQAEDARLAEEQERLAAENQGTDPGGDGGGGEGGDARARAHRPGKLERRLQKTERELGEERRRNAEAHRQVADLHRRLTEANEAGNQLYARSLAQDIEAAEDEFRNAIVAGDADATVKAQRKVSELIAAGQVLKAAPKPQAPAAPQAPQTYTPTTGAWLAANPWYGTDAELTGLAKSVHAAALRQGKTVDTPEYWDFIEKGVEAVSPGTVRKVGTDPDDEDEDTTRTAPRGTGATVTRGGTRSPAAPGAAVRLTAEEADAAKISGLTPQEYKEWQGRLRAAGRIGGAR